MDRATHVVVLAGAVMVVVLLATAAALVAHAPQKSEPIPIAISHPIPLPTVIPIPPPTPIPAPVPRTPPSVDSLLREAALRHDLPPQLLVAVTRVESDFDPHEVSHKGARGLMQIMPETGKRFGVAPEHLFDPERNIAAGAAYLSWLLTRYDNDLDLALAGYNAGEGAVDKYRGIPPYRETREYVQKVRARLREMGM